MELGELGTVSGISSALGGLPARDVLFVAYETLRGLQYLHERHIVHRDIKGKIVFACMHAL